MSWQEAETFSNSREARGEISEHVQGCAARAPRAGSMFGLFRRGTRRTKIVYFSGCAACLSTRFVCLVGLCRCLCVCLSLWLCLFLSVSLCFSLSSLSHSSSFSVCTSREASKMPWARRFRRHSLSGASPACGMSPSMSASLNACPRRLARVALAQVLFFSQLPVPSLSL